MAKISFKSRPQRKYYSYLTDGHIYKITSVEPTVVADSGGYWYCYFKCVPYHKDDDGKTHLLYEKIGNNYYATSSSSFYSGNYYFYFADDDFKKEKPILHQGNYSTMSGDATYAFPQSAAELPQTTFGGNTYYFDKLIGEGDKYDKDKDDKKTKFVPMDVDGVAGTQTTYGSKLLDMVKQSISINAFKQGVNDLPDYLKGNKLEEEYRIENIGYSIPADYFIVFGPLFMKKLNDEMKKTGETIVKSYSKNIGENKYKNVTISAAVDASGTPVGTIKSTPIE